MGMTDAVYRRLYGSAENPEDLPWSHTDPTDFLSDSIDEREAPGRALDVGCGTGTDSVFLASRGWHVTGLDFVADALEMATKRADDAGVSATFIETDVTAWKTDAPFDLVVDRGCLHNFKPNNRNDYRERLLEWLAPGGDYILAHFNKRHVFDWRPIGPRRLRAKDIFSFFAPELEEWAFKTIDNIRQPLPVGPTISVNTFWFKHRSS